MMYESVSMKSERCKLDTPSVGFIKLRNVFNVCEIC